MLLNLLTPTLYINIYMYIFFKLFNFGHFDPPYIPLFDSHIREDSKVVYRLIARM